MSALGSRRTQAAIFMLVLLLAEEARNTVATPRLHAMKNTSSSKGLLSGEAPHEQAESSAFSNGGDAASLAHLLSLEFTEQNLHEALDKLIELFPKDAAVIEQHRNIVVQAILEKQTMKSASTVFNADAIVEFPEVLVRNISAISGARYSFTDDECTDVSIEFGIQVILFIMSFLNVYVPDRTIFAKYLAIGLRAKGGDYLLALRAALWGIVRQKKLQIRAIFQLGTLLVVDGGQVLLQAFKETQTAADWVNTGASFLASIAIFSTTGGTAILFKLAAKYLSAASLVKSIVELQDACVIKKSDSYKNMHRVRLLEKEERSLPSEIGGVFVEGLLEVTLPSGEKVGICYDGYKYVSKSFSGYTTNLRGIPNSEAENAVVCGALGYDSNHLTFTGGFNSILFEAETYFSGNRFPDKRYLRMSTIKCSGFESNLGQCKYSYKLMKSCKNEEIPSPGNYFVYYKNAIVTARCYKKIK